MATDAIATPKVDPFLLHNDARNPTDNRGALLKSPVKTYIQTYKLHRLNFT